MAGTAPRAAASTLSGRWRPAHRDVGLAVSAGSATRKIRRPRRALATGCALGLCAALLAGGCAVNPATGQSDFVTMSEAQEVAVGRQAQAEVLQQYSVHDDAALQAYVNAVGQRVATHGHRPGLEYRFTVLDSPETNAFALPGGYIYITRGLLAYLNSEAELAAVLGHEVGHVTARHAVRQQSTAQAASLGAGLLSIFVPQLGVAGRQAVNLLGTALVRGYGRDHELEADRLGAEYLARSGYDPAAMINVLRTLKDQEVFDQKLAALEGRPARAYHGVFSTHPDNDTRLAEAIATARQYVETQGELGRDRLLDELDGLVIGGNPQDGVIREHVFVHPGLDFVLSFPSGWVLQNLPDRLIAREPGGFAQMQVALAPVDDAATPDAVLQKLGVREFVGGKRFSAGDAAGLTGLTRVAVQGQARTARLSVLLHGGRAFVITGVTARDPDMAQFDPTFVAVAQQFRRLSEEERKRAVPRRLRVVDLKGGVTWAGLAKASPLKRLAEAQLRLLNAAEAGATAPTMRRIKVVE